jgi:hypothetical protein
MLSGKVTLECSSVEKFVSTFSQFDMNYPMLRAARKYKDSLLEVDEKAGKVIGLILRRGHAHAE